MSKIRQCFVSRFPNGKIVEADFSQLEVVVQAMLTNSKQLIADINAGTDMHKVRAADMYSIPPSAVTKQQRQTAKACSFQLAYGAGYKSMAVKLKVSEKLTKKFVDDFFKRYPEVKAFNTKNMDYLTANSKPSNIFDKHGVQLRRSTLTTALGRKYTFFQKEYNGSYNFSPTDVSNYPIQGTAADFVAVYRARLYRALIELQEPEIVPIGTVHDSVVFDVTEDKIELLVAVLDCLLTNLNQLLRDLFPALETPIQLKVDVKAGVNWMEQEEIAKLPTGTFA